MKSIAIQNPLNLRAASFEGFWTIEKDEGAGKGWEKVMIDGMENRFAAGYKTLEQAQADMDNIAGQLRGHGLTVEIMQPKV